MISGIDVGVLGVCGHCWEFAVICGWLDAWCCCYTKTNGKQIHYDKWQKKKKSTKVIFQTCTCGDCCEFGECNDCCKCCWFDWLRFVSLAIVVEFKLMFGFARPNVDGICIWFVCIVSIPDTGMKPLSSYYFLEKWTLV